MDPQHPTQPTWADAQDPSQPTWAASESSQYRSPPTDRSWQDQKNDQNDPIPQSGTGPEIDPQEWTGPGREPSKGNIEDVLQGCGPVKCPICGKYIRGGRWQLRSHQLTSSRCLAASGQAPQAREACELCGKQIAAGDAWANPGYRRRGRSSSRQHGTDRYSDSASAASASDTHSLDARWHRRVRSQSSDRAVNRGRSASIGAEIILTGTTRLPTFTETLGSMSQMMIRLMTGSGLAVVTADVQMTCLPSKS